MLYLVAVTFVSPVVGGLITLLYLIANWKCTVRASHRPLFGVFAILFASYGYSITFPDAGESDLTRYFDMIDQIMQSGQTLPGIWKEESQWMYTKDVLFYFVARTGDVHILPYIVGLTIYGICFYVLFDMISRANRTFTIGEAVLIGVVMVGIITPYHTIINVRCVLAYTLISFATYRDMVQKKKNLITVLLYILPIGLHISAVIVLGIRILQVFAKYIGKAAVGVAVVIPLLINLAYDNLGFLERGIVGSIIGSAVKKAYYYLYWTEGGWATEVQKSLSNRLTRIYGTFYIILFFLMLFVSRYYDQSKKKNSTVLLKPMVSYIYLTAICTLGCLSITTGAFWRLEAVVVLFSPVYLIPLMEHENRWIVAGLKLLFASAAVMFCLGLVIQYRNLDPLGTFASYVLFSGVRVLFGIIKIFL